MIKINKISWKNFRSYGNDLHEINFGKGELILLCGPNGAGKSVHPDTLCRITTSDNEKVLEWLNKKRNA